LTLPVPTAEECDLAQSRLAELAKVRQQIANFRENLAVEQRQLWQMPYDGGDE
jgi:hypothetical protein